jgi:family 2 glucosyltransferase
MVNRKEKVSVAMATYNGEKYIKEQIETILNNLDDKDELVISDDGSSDMTIEIINKINDKRIKLLEGPRKGLKKNFENAIKNTTGDVIFLSDQDDIWMENKVEKVLECFNNNNYILIQHDAVVVGENDKVIYESFAEHRKVKTGVIKNLIKNSYHGCCIAFRKELIKEILPIPDNVYLHDEWIGIVAELNGKTYFLDEKLIKYRRHSENTSSFKHLPVKEMFLNRVNYTKEIYKYNKNKEK